MSDESPRWPEASAGRLIHAGVLIALQAATMVALFAFILPALGGDMGRMLEAGPFGFGVMALMVLLQTGGVLGLGLLALGRVSPRQLGWRAEGLGIQILLGLAGAALMVGVLLATFALLTDTPLSEVLAAMGGWSPAQRLLFLAVGVNAALTEESLFRGYLQPALIRWMGAPAGILASAAIFSAYHLNFSPLSLIPKLGFGLILGGLRGRDRPLVAPAIAHALFWVLVGWV